MQNDFPNNLITKIKRKCFIERPDKNKTMSWNKLFQVYLVLLFEQLLFAAFFRFIFSLVLKEKNKFYFFFLIIKTTANIQMKDFQKTLEGTEENFLIQSSSSSDRQALTHHKFFWSEFFN